MQKLTGWLFVVHIFKVLTISMVAACRRAAATVLGGARLFL